MGKKKQAVQSKKMPAKTELPVITVAALAVVLILIAASGYWSYDKWITQVEQQRLNQYSQQQARQRAADIEFYIKEQQQQLNHFSERPVILNATRSSINAEMNRSLINNLKTAYPNALSFKLLTLDRKNQLSPPATTDTDNPTPEPTIKPLTFTELDMINRAEKQEIVPPEALKVGKQWYLHFIASVADPQLTSSGEEGSAADNFALNDTAESNSATDTDNTQTSETSGVIATLLVTLPAQELFQRISRKDPELGQTRLMWDNAGRPVPIYTASQGNAGPALTSPVSKSEWLVSFTPSETLAEQAAESPVLLILMHVIGGGLLLGLVYWLTGKRDPQRLARSSMPHGTPNPQVQPDINDPSYQDHDILDLHVSEEDQDLLGLEESERAAQKAARRAPADEQIVVPDEVFRSYDIRGLAETQITPTLARQVGQAIASEALAAGDTGVFVARDGRSHSPELCEALIEGILSTGCNAINLGAIPTPLLYFATCELAESNSGVMVTASHNSAEYNGFKMVINGHTLADGDVQNIKTRIQTGDVYRGTGIETSQQVIPEYIDRIFSDVALAGDVKLVIDAGNGITGDVAPQLFEELGCEVEPLFCDIDGSFPNHDPDPTIEANLQDLIRTVQSTEADLGVAFDGDGDRLVLVTPKGQIIWPDRLLMLFAKDIVARNPGADVLFDVKCTRELNSLVSSYGGRPIMWKAGHSHMKTKMQETGALVGGEMSGHIFIKDRWYGFDDGMYAAARLLEIMTLRDQDIDSLFDSFPNLPSTPELKIPVAETRKFELVKQLIQEGDFQNGKPITIDGLRVDFSKGWGLVRASNTSAALTLRFEAETQEVLTQLQQLFKRELLKIDSSLDVPF